MCGVRSALASRTAGTATGTAACGDTRVTVPSGIGAASPRSRIASLPRASYSEVLKLRRRPGTLRVGEDCPVSGVISPDKPTLTRQG